MCVYFFSIFVRFALETMLLHTIVREAYKLGGGECLCVFQPFLFIFIAKTASNNFVVETDMPFCFFLPNLQRKPIATISHKLKMKTHIIIIKHLRLCRDAAKLSSDCDKAFVVLP